MCPHCGWRVQSASGSNLPRIRDDDRITAVDLRAPSERESSLELPPDDDEPPSLPLKLPPDRAAEPPSLLEARPAAIELPPSEDSVAPRASAPRPSAPTFQPTLPSLADSVLPEWAQEPLDPAGQLALSLSIGLFLMLAVESATVGRLQTNGVVRGLVLVLLAAASVGFFRFSRLGVVGCAIAGLVSSASAAVSGELAAALALLGWTVAVAGVSLGQARPRWLGLGALSFGVMAPCLLDGVTSRPLFESFLSPLSRAQRVSAPFLDQRSGLQLQTTSAHLSVVETTSTGLRLADRVEGYEVGAWRLPNGTLPLAGKEEAERWLAERGITKLVTGVETASPGTFDTAAVVPFTARNGRQQLSGIVRVAHLGPESFAIVGWTRAHRSPQLADHLRTLVESVGYRPPRRPVLTASSKLTVKRALVSAGGLTGARVMIGAHTVLVIGDRVPRGLVTCSSEAGPFDADFSRATEASGALVMGLGGGGTVPLRGLTHAPKLTRIVVLTADAMAGGWLSDDPGSATRRVDLQGLTEGPAFDLEGAFVGLVHDRETLITVEALSSTLETVGGGKIALAPASNGSPEPLFAPFDDAPKAAERDLSRSVVQVRSPAGVTGAAVFASTDSSWALVADSAIAPPGTSTVTVRLSDGETRLATVGRTSGRAVLLIFPKEGPQELTLLPVIEGAAAPGRKTVWGFREDAIAGDALKSIDGALGPDGFEADPGPAPTGGPIVGADGRLAALLVRGTQQVVAAQALESLRLPAIKDVVWRIRVEESGTCQLAADAELDDPLRVAKTFLLRLEPAATEKIPARLIAASFVEAPVKGLTASLARQFDCLSTPRWLQFEVQSPAGNVSTKVRRLRAPRTFPDVIQGRAGGSPEAPAPSPALTAQLWVLPPAVTHVHPCASKPELCERACEVDQADACVLEGRYALGKQDLAKAIARLDPACARGDLEACVLLSFAVSEKRPKTLRAKPDDVLEPWCEAGVGRACAALDPKGWRTLSQSLAQRCQRRPSECPSFAAHLLEGPALDGDRERALKLLRSACGTGDLHACVAASSEALRLGLEEPLPAMKRASRACARKLGDACLLEAMNFALGVTQPKTALGAQRALEEACRLGSAEACEMSHRD